jgi:hypothetical protein
VLEGRSFLFGEHATAADCSAYHAYWFLQTLCPERLEPYGGIREWMDRCASIGHGTARPMTSAEAIEVCRGDQRALPAQGGVDELSGVALGQRVSVRARDYGRDSVTGELVLADVDEVALQRTDDRAGRVVVHFPRIGYELMPA